MAGASIERLKHQLGLPAAPCRASLPLRACPCCMEEHRQRHGVASWRRSHQLPGSLFCAAHGLPLLKSKQRIDRLGKTQFILPDDPLVFEATSPALSNPKCAILLHRLAALNTHILNAQLPLSYRRELMPLVYRHGLKAHGMLTKGGHLRANEYLNWLHSHFAAVKHLKPFCYVLAGTHHHTLLRMVRKPRTDFHPFYHLLLIDAIFGGWNLFAEAYAWEACMESSTQEPPTVPKTPSIPAHIEAFAATAKANQEDSMARLADQCGLNIGTAMRWAGKLGLTTIQRRPKILHHELKNAVLDALRKGEPQRDIALKTGLSRATVDRVCQEQPGLNSLWKSANQEWKRTQAREAISNWLQTHPEATLADARAASPPGYCWLHRHDSEWLRATFPPKVREAAPRCSPNRLIVDWAARDEACFEQLSQLADTVIFASWERLKPGTLLRKLPALPFSPRLDRLPRSKALAAQILSDHIARRHSRRK